MSIVEDDNNHRIDWSKYSILAEEFGTPLYIFYPDKALQSLKNLQNGLLEWGKGRIAYSIKTNPLSELLKLYKSQGVLAEVVSGWEYQIARSVGFLPHQIIFGGPCKTAESISQAIDENVLSINIDSYEEIEIITDLVRKKKTIVNIGLRIAHKLDSGFTSRFGLDVETGEFQRTLETVIKNPNLNLKSIQTHLGTQVESIDSYKNSCAFMQSVWKDFKLNENVLMDIGGGYPYQHDVEFENQVFSPNILFNVLNSNWTLDIKPNIVVEAGRYLAAGCFSVLSKVLSYKKRNNEPSIVVIDSGTNHNVMGAFYNHIWDFQSRNTQEDSYRICGPLCMEDDVMSAEIYGRPPSVGSYVLMKNSGAYSLSLSRTFIQPRPPIIKYCINDDSCLLLNERESLESLYGFLKSSLKNISA